MLEEVRGAIGPVGLGARASVDPDAHSRGLRPRRVLGSDLQRRPSAIDSSIKHRAYRQAVGQRGGLGERTLPGGRGKASCEGDAGDRRTPGQALLEAEAQAAGGHGSSHCADGECKESNEEEGGRGGEEFSGESIQLSTSTFRRRRLTVALESSVAVGILDSLKLEIRLWPISARLLPQRPRSKRAALALLGYAARPYEIFHFDKTF